MLAIVNNLKKKISPAQLFMISTLIVNGGNYLYNLLVGRILGPEKFADAAILITILLVISFIAMTFQLVTAKFSIGLENSKLNNLIKYLNTRAVGLGIIIGIILICLSNQIQLMLNTSTNEMFIIFGISIPLYFLISINRGIYQGTDSFNNLSWTYQTEMLSRLSITLILLWLLNIDHSIIIALGILISLIFGLYPLNNKVLHVSLKNYSHQLPLKKIKIFIGLTAFYEFTQIIINNSDIILVKHFFNANEAGLYSSIALIGRLIYYITWMFVMLLLPTVVQLEKEGKKTSHILFKYVGYTIIIALSTVIGCMIFPKFIVGTLFGKAYLPFASMLWKYAIATSMFAVANIFVYYYLSLEKYLPVAISALFGFMQIILVSMFHNNIDQVIYMQIISMGGLLISQITYYLIILFKKSKNNI